MYLKMSNESPIFFYCEFEQKANSHIEYILFALDLGQCYVWTIELCKYRCIYLVCCIRNLRLFHQLYRLQLLDQWSGQMDTILISVQTLQIRLTLLREGCWFFLQVCFAPPFIISILVFQDFFKSFAKCFALLVIVSL